MAVVDFVEDYLKSTALALKGRARPFGAAVLQRRASPAGGHGARRV